MSALLRNTTVNATVCRAAASDPLLLATDLADYLVRKGVPFRQAHHLVGSLVASAEQSGRSLNQLTVDEFRRVDKHFGPDVTSVFDLDRAMARRQLAGSPGTAPVRKELARWRKVLG